MPISNPSSIDGWADVYDLLEKNGGDMRALRPFRGDGVNGAIGQNYRTRTVVSANGARRSEVVVTNAPATITYDGWKTWDDVVLETIQNELKVFDDLRQISTYTLPQGMAHISLHHQILGDISDATLSMDPARRSEVDRPTVDSASIPLPLAHKDFDFSTREVMASRLGRVPLPLDDTSLRLGAQKVAQVIEKLTVGSISFTDNGGTIYGLTNHPNRAIKTDMVVPTGANGEAVVTSWLALMQMMVDDNHDGPYAVYVNSQWSQFLDNEFKANSGQSLRQRLLAIEAIDSITTSKWLSPTKYGVVFMEKNPIYNRAIVGFDAMPVHWESAGGYMKHSKVIAMLIPHFRADAAGNAAIGHGTTAP